MPDLPWPDHRFVVDDHTLFRQGLMALIGQDAELRVIGDASDASRRCAKCHSCSHQVICWTTTCRVLGVDAIAGLRQASQMVVVMQLVSEDGQDLATALPQWGAGLFLKTMDGELLFEAIRRATPGRASGQPSCWANW